MQKLEEIEKAKKKLRGTHSRTPNFPRETAIHFFWKKIWVFRSVYNVCEQFGEK